MNKTYLITLTPMGKFFFGGDMTFTVNGKETDYTSYIIRSTKFPQQTSLLGMLRFLILRNDTSAFNALSQSITDRDKARELIGAKSFEASGGKGSFGVIDSISPCFVQEKNGNGWDDLALIPKGTLYKVDFSAPSKAVINGMVVDVPQTDYNPKDYCETSYRNTRNDAVIEESKIFAEDICNGINRDIQTGKTDDNALFKQVSYRLNEDYRFAFYADVDLDSFSDYNGQIVSVGADNSQFVIGISECKCVNDEKSEGNVVTLLSPAYITKEDLASVRFAITETTSFKCMKTETDSIKSYNKRNQLYGYSNKLSLYATGSVFFFKTESEASAFADKLKNHSDFYQIGYNHYQLMNLSTNK